MSSFVINKVDYVKCAGFLSAFTEIKKINNEPILRIWDISKNCAKDAKDVLNDFCKLAELNAESVALQYNEENNGVEDCMYEDEFSKYYKQAKLLFKYGGIFTEQEHKKQLQHAIYSVIKFFKSILYQIEDEKCAKQANFILQVLDGFNNDDFDTWGTFEIFDNLNNEK